MIINNKKITKPNLILDALNQEITTTFTKNEQKMNDGMDITIIRYNSSSNILECSSAMNNAYLVDNKKEITVIKGNRYPIGGNPENYKNRKHYDLYSIQLKSDTILYMFSDGFQDQFGGPKGKKYLKKNFRELLTNISSLSIEEQEATLKKEFNDWKGSEEQVDDVLVAGIKLKIN